MTSKISLPNSPFGPLGLKSEVPNAKSKSKNPKWSDAQLAQVIQVGIRQRVGLDLLLAEAFVVPHVQVVQLTDHRYFPAHRRRLTELGRNQNSTLGVDTHLLSKIIDAVEELLLGFVCGGQGGEFFFRLAPNRKRIDLGCLTIQAGYKEVRAVRFQFCLEGHGNFQTTLGVHRCHVPAPESCWTFHLYSVQL